LKIVGQSEERAEMFLDHLQRWREDKTRHRNAYKRLSRKRRAPAIALRGSR
jgi:ferric-dicitrate binding protein FerR (iron transport regulator)